MNVSEIGIESMVTLYKLSYNPEDAESEIPGKLEN